jgi:hypothetical protein
MKVKLPIFWHSDETRMRSDLGIEDDDDDFSKYEVREVIFYAITGICKYMNEEKHTNIYVGSERFICPLPATEVEKLIDESL